MKPLSLSPDERAPMLDQLQDYLADELGMELGQFEVEFLLDQMIKTLGAKFYNQGLEDARVAILARMELATEVVYEMEQPLS
ncbi:Uncharacterized conserved protein, DUF2164 family [Ferrimonas sediminum]|uniref:Uncharacterized conserved protein, DUF2164 family n=1 Tax=Ferrimonas sediminum TaxID=718193 RepID=A0A1G8N3U5_9GAMM|nr:DUF2164 domain-containing protein [Ferrimonas sediminum]SDI74949.1 Uncharacterized conserved protein, DUF2164 family [Ferrimonas sediminum]